MAFRGNAESAKSSNRGNYVELLHAFAEKDEKLARHLETSTVFSGLSNRIQNDLIEAVSDVIKNDIRHEINAAPFVGVEVDETTDVTNKAQVSVILRYVDTSDVKEAFLGFDDVSDDRRAPAIADCIQQNVCLSAGRFLKQLRDLRRFSTNRPSAPTYWMKL